MLHISLPKVFRKILASGGSIYDINKSLVIITNQKRNNLNSEPSLVIPMTSNISKQQLINILISLGRVTVTKVENSSIFCHQPTGRFDCSCCFLLWRFGIGFGDISFIWLCCGDNSDRAYNVSPYHHLADKCDFSCWYFSSNISQCD